MACNNQTRRLGLDFISPSRSTNSKSSSTTSQTKSICSNTRKARAAGTPERSEGKKTRATCGKSSRIRASRLSREWQIPLTNIHGLPVPSVEHRLRGKLHGLFEKESTPSLVNAGMVESVYKGGRPRTTYNQLYAEKIGDQNIAATSVNRSENRNFHECSGSDGDISDVGGDDELKIFQLPQLTDNPKDPLRYERCQVSSAPNESFNFSDLSDNGPINYSEMEKWGAEDWRFQAEVLMAECDLLRSEKDLAVRRWQQGRAEKEQAVCMAQALRLAFWTLSAGRKKNGSGNTSLESSQINLQADPLQALDETFDRLEDNTKDSEIPINNCNSYAEEDLKRLAKFHNMPRVFSEITKFQSLSNPTKELQERLKKCFLAVQYCTASKEHENQTGDISGRKDDDHTNSLQLVDGALAYHADLDISQSLWSDKPFYVTTADERKRQIETSALRKQLDNFSSELIQTQEIAASIRKEYRSMLSIDSTQRFSVRLSERRPRHQEMNVFHWKAALREIAAHVQAETEQWSQVQDIIILLQEEMEDLNEAREHWEKRALHAEAQLTALQELVHEWRVRALAAEKEVATLQSQVHKMSDTVEKMEHWHALKQRRWLEARTNSLSRSIIEGNTLNTCKDGDDEVPSCDINHMGTQRMIGGASKMDASEKIESADSVLQDEYHNSQQVPDLWNRGAVDFSHTSCEDALSICKVRQKYHTASEPSIGLDEQRVSSNQQLEQCTFGKKVHDISKENRPCSSTKFPEISGHAQFGTADFQQNIAKSAFLEDDMTDVPKFKSSSLETIRLPFGEILNMAPLPCLKTPLFQILLVKGS